MCHDCGAPLTMSKGSKEKQETLTSVESKGRDPKLSCNFCLEKQDKESLNQTGLSACPKQHVSPTSSLTSSDSTVSCCSKVSTIPIIILIRLQLCNHFHKLCIYAVNILGFSGDISVEAYSNGRYTPQFIP